MITIERQPVRTRPGFDCIYDNANCPACAREGRRIVGNHGINGGAAWFGMIGTTETGGRVAISLEVRTCFYPETIPNDHWSDEPGRNWGPNHPPRGATLSIHVPGTEHACEYLGCCNSELIGYMVADKLYKAYGNQDPTADPAQQSDAFWNALADELVKWAGTQP